MISPDKTHHISGDRPLGPGKPDLLGFEPLAARLATSLIDRASEDGLVIGVEGAWGAGKSSLLYLLRHQLALLPESKRPRTIDFQPWLIGNREALIAALFKHISSTLDSIALDQGNANRITIQKAKDASKALNRFSKALSKAGDGIGWASTFLGIPWLAWLSPVLKSVGFLTEVIDRAPDLPALKRALEADLRALNCRIVITIDDLDRLEPLEAIEMLRLVRSVIDLPNIIYVLCYDAHALARSIENALNIDSGRTYLEKIVQLEISVPRPEEMQLRNWFSNELNLIATTATDEDASRLKQVIDQEGGRQLSTPRSVIRALDGVRVFWPALRDESADLPDIVWLQLIKNGNQALYRWIEKYCAQAAVLSHGTSRISDSEVATIERELASSVPEEWFEDALFKHLYSSQLLGLTPALKKEGKPFRLFEKPSIEEVRKAISGKRLASPDHYRLYFALSNPSFALSSDEFSGAWNAAELGSNAFAKTLLALHKEKGNGTQSKAELLLERISGGAYEKLTVHQCANLLRGLADVMDEAYRLRPFEEFFVETIWDKAMRATRPLLAKLDGERSVVGLGMFEHGASVGWLTAVFRHETFSHGRFGDRPSPESEWIFSDAELTRISQIMIARYKGMTPEAWASNPFPLRILFAWLQGGDRDGPRDFVALMISSDAGLINTLQLLQSEGHSSSDGKYYSLEPDGLKELLDYDSAERRVTALQADSKLGQQAQALSKAFARGRYWSKSR